MVENKFPIVDAAVVLECSPPLGLALANKGAMSFEFTVYGADRLLHEMQVPFDHNPTYWQAELIVALQKLNKQLSKRKHRYGGQLYINVMSVNHPIFSNTIPMSIKIKGTRRVNPDETVESVTKEFETLLNDLKKRSPLKIQMNLTGEPAQWEVSAKEPVVKSFQRAFKEVKRKLFVLAASARAFCQF